MARTRAASSGGGGEDPEDLAGRLDRRVAPGVRCPPGERHRVAGAEVLLAGLEDDGEVPGDDVRALHVAVERVEVVTAVAAGVDAGVDDLEALLGAGGDERLVGTGATEVDRPPLAGPDD